MSSSASSDKPLPIACRAALSTFASLLLVHCDSLPAVPITTPEPIEVNLNMRLDVYQYTGDAPANEEELVSLNEAVQRRRNRMDEVQTLKNNRLVGENHRGLLQLREVPAGEWGDYVKRTVEAENHDRNLIMRNEAKESSRALHEVQEEYWRQNLDLAYEGEWVEVEGEKPNTYAWVQSEGPTTRDSESRSG